MNNKICEYCKIDHDGSYGSGRFCSQKCARGSATVGTQNKTKISYCIQCEKQVVINLRSANILCQQCKSKKYKFEGICQLCGQKFVIHKQRNRPQKFCSKSCQSKFASSVTWDSNHRSYTMSKFNQSWQSGIRPCRGGRCKRYKYKDILVQGTYQFRTCCILDKFVELKKIKSWQYTKDRIKYKWQNGTEHYYFPDFKVINNDNSWYYLEIKGFKKDIDKLKWEQTIQQGYALKVWFEKDIIENEQCI